MLQRLFSAVKSVFQIIYLVIVTLPRDIKGLLIMRRIETKLDDYERSEQTIPKLFSRLHKKHPNKPCFIFENTIWTFNDVEIYSNRVAHTFSKKYGLKKGDVCALFMENKIEYAPTWLGLSKIGVITALINTNLRNDPLVHSITIANSKFLIYGAELTESLDQVRNELYKSVKFIVQGSKLRNTTDDKLEDLLEDASTSSFMSEQHLCHSDILIYIYTSGTTGLPKPAVIKHSRFYASGVAYFIAANLNDKDIMYNSLPIYHGNGGMIVIALCFCEGVTIVLRKKFSASNFWKECAQYKCTAMIYVGEVCRYLVNQPPSDYDKLHNVRIAIGNGCRANIWSDFSSRFGVKVFEFYAASEGNCTIMNIVSKVGACGFVPVLNQWLKKLAINIICVDNEMNPIRDSKGLCITCKPGEKGLAVGLLGDKPTVEYSGYANNKSASEKKIIDNVFKKGQRAFNTGDLMMCDKYGFIYFCDRLGDTYRWKGENVSTVEIENIISAKLDFTECVVYGVEIPGQEGRAGMVSILKLDVNLNRLYEDLKKDLPPYARPIFIRLVDNVDHTGSFRAQKHKLVDSNYDISKIKDKLYYLDLKEQAYLPLTKGVYELIQNMSLKF